MRGINIFGTVLLLTIAISELAGMICSIYNTLSCDESKVLKVFEVIGGKEMRGTKR